MWYNNIRSNFWKIFWHFLHFLFNDSKSFFQCWKSLFQCWKCRCLQTMFNKIFSQLKYTTMASVRPKLVKQGQWVQCSTWLHAVHVPVFLSQFHNIKKSNIIKYQPAGSRAACGDMFPTPFREPNHGGSQILPWEFLNWYQNIWIKEIQKILRECNIFWRTEETTRLMPNWVHATFGQQQHLYQWALWLAGYETNAHAQNEMKWKMGENKSDYEI